MLAHLCKCVFKKSQDNQLFNFLLDLIKILQKKQKVVLLYIQYYYSQIAQSNDQSEFFWWF